MSEKNYANIMMIGRTGVGKSSFLNYLLDTDDFKTGKGEPVTQGFETLEFENINGLPIRVYDSKGLEVIDLNAIKNNIISYLKKTCGDNDPMKWIHSIFYCVSVKRARFEPEEVNLIKEICSSISQTVHIVFTHCDSPDSGADLEKHIRDSLNMKNIKFIRVNSVTTKKRTGVQTEPFGREEALDTIFSVLWSDIAYRVSHQYAKEFKKSLDNLYYEMCSMFDSVTNKMTTLNVIKEFINEGGMDDMLEDASDRYEENRDAEMERLSQKYTAIINPVVDFYNNYSDGLGYRIQALDFIDFVPDECLERMEDLDFDEILENSRMGRLMEEIDDADDDSLFGMLKMIGKAVGMLLRIQSLLKDVIYDIKYEFRKTLPTEDEIAEEMYRQLLEAIK